MRKSLQSRLLIAFGWLFITLGAIGAVVPILPTTPFLIVALALFSRSSPRFHRMLLENKWFGPSLRQWEETRSLSRRTKYTAVTTILLVFSTSIAVLSGKPWYQLGLAALGVLLIGVIWRIREEHI